MQIPAVITELLRKEKLCEKINGSYEEIRQVILGWQESITTDPAKAAEAGPVCMAAGALLTMFQVFRNEGRIHTSNK